MNAPLPPPEDPTPKATDLVRRVALDRFTLARHDERSLQQARGLSIATIERARLGSLRVQEDLDELGLDWNIDALPSLLVIPYASTLDADGKCLIRIHKRSLPATIYPPYLPTPLDDDGPVVVCESELKALAAAQLGCRAIGLQGIDSFVNRIDEIIDAVKSFDTAAAFVCFDLEREIVEDPDKATHRESVRAALTYTLALQQAGFTVRIADLPDRYLEETRKDETA